MRAPDSIVGLAANLIDSHYPNLQDAAIGILIREDAPVKDGRVVLGGTKKIGEIEREFMDYDFVIWLAVDVMGLAQAQQVACVDHYLCSCVFDPSTGKAKIRQPDVATYTEVLQRHGVWWPGGQEVRTALLQAPLFERAGRVEAVEGPDVLDQLNDLDLD